MEKIKRIKKTPQQKLDETSEKSPEYLPNLIEYIRTRKRIYNYSKGQRLKDENTLVILATDHKKPITISRDPIKGFVVPDGYISNVDIEELQKINELICKEIE